MIPHTLHIGEKVWNDYDCEWGYIESINGKTKDTTICNKNRKMIVTLMDAPNFEKSTSHLEVTADDVYQIAEGLKFKGETVCFEHRQDEMADDYEYFCPELGLGLSIQNIDYINLKKIIKNK